MAREKIAPLKKMVGPLAPKNYHNGNRFGIEHLILVALLTAIVTAFATHFGFDTARAVAGRLPANAGRLINTTLRTP